MTHSDAPSSHDRPAARVNSRGVVWLVDDSPLETRIGRETLETEWDVEVFGDGESLIEKLSMGTAPDALVVDWTLPGMSGLDVCRYVRESHDEIALPILVLTATHDRADDMVVALAAGANDYLTKPFVPLELRARVRTLVRLRSFHDRAMEAELALRAAHDRVELIARVGIVMGRSLDYESRLVDLAELLVPVLGNGSLVTIVEPDGRLVRQAGAGWGRARVEAITRVKALPVPAAVESLLREVMTTRRARLVTDYTAEILPRVTDDARYVAAVSALAVRGYVAAPLVVGDRVLGVLSVGTAGDRAYTAADVTLVEEIAQRAAYAIDHARLFREAERQRTRLRELIQQAPVAICVLCGPTHVFEIVNPPYLAIVGEGRELLGRTVAEAQPGLVAQGFVAGLDRVYATGEAMVGRNVAVRVWNEDGGEGTRDEQFFDYVFQPTRDAAGDVDGTMVVVTDVTEQVRARVLTEAARAQAESDTRTKDQFLATVSHELRTPINSILGWVKMLRGDALPGDRRERALESVERSARMQSQLVEDLLDISRITTGTLRIESEPTSLVAVIEAAIDVVRPAADAKSIRLDAALDPFAGTVRGDAARLQQVVWNLLMNAVKFTPRSGRVQVVLERIDDWAEIVVSDNGQGIPQDFLPHVFEVFRRADGADGRSHGGLGLGLSIVKTLVELHGGAVRAMSDGRGQGSTFVARLPLAWTEGSHGARHSFPVLNPEASPECPPEIAGLRVLVVDDEPDVRELLVAVLEGCGAQVASEPGVAAAMVTFARFRPAVVVSDIGMPGEDGHAFAQRVRALPVEQGGRTPMVALTAYARPGDRARALRSGFDMHVPKPIEPSELLSVIANLVAAHGAG